MANEIIIHIAKTKHLFTKHSFFFDSNFFIIIKDLENFKASLANFELETNPIDFDLKFIDLKEVDLSNILCIGNPKRLKGVQLSEVIKQLPAEIKGKVKLHNINKLPFKHCYDGKWRLKND